MLRQDPSVSAQPDLPPSQHPQQQQQRHQRGSSYHALRSDHGYQLPRQHHQLHERNDSTNSITSPPPTTATPPRRENAFTSPRPALLPYQEYHSGFADVDLASSPVPSPSYSPSHRRQSSFSALLPLAIRNRTPSPTRKSSVLPEEITDMAYTGDNRTSPSRPGTAVDSSPRGGFAGWLSGTAAGNALDSLSQSPNTTPTRLRKPQPSMLDGPNPTTTPTESVSTRASRFMSALSARITPQAAGPTTNPAVLDDELCNLQIETALFPPNSPGDRDAFSPAAFKNLQANAVGLLAKFQSAYRARVLALHDLEAERAAEKDEMEEAVTRAAHLRAQLEGMARRADEQEKAMRALMGELMAERRGREEERLERMRRTAGGMAGDDFGVGVEDEEWSGTRKRKSGGSGEESTFDETDEESVDESVFSRSRSPTGTTTTVAESVVVKSNGGGGGTVRPAAAAAARNSAQMSTFQKIFKNIAGDIVEETNGCRNCRGKDASVAWDTVSLLRDENKHLKQRVGQLEVAVEGALDLVNGLGL
ncbi:hypothetical protein GE09DRAFT_109483 [Coniochaeta sp. 2T2.1]|nr:hypothetical protein GE09DRAFT_109483 [Coniochaeta sp. 2T2.1]